MVLLKKVSRMLVEVSYKALTNSLIRKNFEAASNQRLIDKHVSWKPVKQPWW